MNLYLDDNSCKGLLATLLRKTGHAVVIPPAVGCAGASDARHFIHAIQANLVIVTRDYGDFLDLHDVVQVVHGQHAGILAIRLDNDTTRDSSSC